MSHLDIDRSFVHEWNELPTPEKSDKFEAFKEQLTGLVKEFIEQQAPNLSVQVFEDKNDKIILIVNDGDKFCFTVTAIFNGQEMVMVTVSKVTNNGKTTKHETKNFDMNENQDNIKELLTEVF